MNNTGIEATRSDYLFRIGKTINGWYAVLGEFYEQSNHGRTEYTKTIKGNYGENLVIRYSPEYGWGTELL